MPVETLTADWVGVLAVDVVDGTGEGVSGETVEAVYRLADGSRAGSGSVTRHGRTRRLRRPAAGRTAERGADRRRRVDRPDGTGRSDIAIET